MIAHFSDLCANARTELACFRTAVSPMGFGSLIERFAVLLVQTTRSGVPNHGLQQRTLEWLGLGSILPGAALILLAMRGY